MHNRALAGASNYCDATIANSMPLLGGLLTGRHLDQYQSREFTNCIMETFVLHYDYIRKGKPFERVGRKASGLQSSCSMVAGLPLDEFIPVPRLAFSGE